MDAYWLSAIDAQVKWTTATEDNNSHFEVERSFDGLEFDKIGVVHSKATNGQSQTKIDYTFDDYKVANAMNQKVFYRLKQVDFDGQYAYSPVVDLTKETSKAMAVKVYPNPTNASVNVSISNYGEAGASTGIKVMDVLGKTIHDQNLVNDGIVLNTVLDMSSYAQGVYHVVITSGNHSEVVKVVKQN
jgi:hypothetical protein